VSPQLWNSTGSFLLPWLEPRSRRPVGSTDYEACVLEAAQMKAGTWGGGKSRVVQDESFSCAFDTHKGVQIPTVGEEHMLA